MTSGVMNSPGKQSRRMLRGPRNVAGVVLALAVLIHAGQAHAQGNLIRIPGTELSPISGAHSYASSTANSWASSALSPSIGQTICTFDPSLQTFITSTYHGEVGQPGSVSPPLPDYDGPRSTEGRALFDSLTVRELVGSRDNPATVAAIREARFRLVKALDSTARQGDRFDVRYRYRELHRLMLDELLIDELSIRPFEVLQEERREVRHDSWVEVCGQPAAGEQCFTRRELLVHARTPLYVIDSTGPVWTLVVQPKEEGKLGAFVGWIKMGGFAYIPARPSSAVAGIVLEPPTLGD